jgi:hypothetical protein
MPLGAQVLMPLGVRVLTSPGARAVPVGGDTLQEVLQLDSAQQAEHVGPRASPHPRVVHLRRQAPSRGGQGLLRDEDHLHNRLSL